MKKGKRFHDEIIKNYEIWIEKSVSRLYKGAKKPIAGGDEKMHVPQNLKYTKTHEWIAFREDGKAKIGITDYAQQALGDIVYVSLPHSGEEYKKGDIFADVESVKMEAEIYMPMDGRILTANMGLVQQPQKVNEDAYGAWLVEVRGLKDEGWMNADEYGKFVEGL